MWKRIYRRAPGNVNWCWCYGIYQPAYSEMNPSKFYVTKLKFQDVAKQIYNL